LDFCSASLVSALGAAVAVLAAGGERGEEFRASA
jgi:hypothetical protein